MHRSKKKRNIIIFSLAGILLCMVVGYAAFQTQLEIKGTSKVTSNWNIQITNVTDGTSTGSAENASNPSWTDLTAYMEANLYNKGDAMEYDVTIENKGTIDAKLNDILTNLEKENNEAVIITFSGYTKGETLKSGESKIVHVKIEYNPNYEGEETSSEVKIDFEYTQNNNETENPDNKYLVTYDCTTNGGTDCSSNNEYKPSGSLVDLNKTGVKQGYTFIGWNTDKDSKETLSELTMEDSNITLYAIFKDETPPTCELKLTEATVNTATVKAICEDISGISKYEYSINNNSYIDNGENNEYVFNSFDLSTIKLKATDKGNNSAEFTFSEKTLEEGYQIIYNVLNKKYAELQKNEEDYQNSFLDKTYPINSIYISINSTNPGQLFGGTWEEFGSGRTLIGVGDNGEYNYTSAGLTGGNEQIKLAVTNLPNHSHTFTPSGKVSSTFTGSNGTFNTVGAHTHSMPYTTTSTSNESGWGGSGAILSPGFIDRLFVNGHTSTTSSAGNHTHTFTAKGSISSSFSGTKVDTSSVGSSSNFDIRNPYITAYMWKRIK